jgi:hypothetical protein
MNAIAMWFRARKIRKTQEKLAYFQGKHEILVEIVSHRHTSSNRDELVETNAKIRQLEQRLKGLHNEPC